MCVGRLKKLLLGVGKRSLAMPNALFNWFVLVWFSVVCNTSWLFLVVSGFVRFMILSEHFGEWRESSLQCCVIIGSVDWWHHNYGTIIIF